LTELSKQDRKPILRASDLSGVSFKWLNDCKSTQRKSGNTSDLFISLPNLGDIFAHFIHRNFPV
jgi:hypothetical protein